MFAHEKFEPITLRFRYWVAICLDQYIPSGEYAADPVIGTQKHRGMVGLAAPRSRGKQRVIDPNLMLCLCDRGTNCGQHLARFAGQNVDLGLEGELAGPG